MKKYRSIFISDIHLGTHGSKAAQLCSFLKANDAENLILVGDIIDGWRLKERWYWPQEHSNVIRRILTAAKRQTSVHYILGNHDEQFRHWIKDIGKIGEIHLANRMDYMGLDGKNYLVVHGDMFDTLMHGGTFIIHLGDKIYDILIRLNQVLAWIRSKLNLPYWSFSKWIKHNTERAVQYIGSYEQHLAAYCVQKGYDGVICGHIHAAEIKNIEGVIYMNDGDWVESCTALVENHDSSWEIIHWPHA